MKIGILKKVVCDMLILNSTIVWADVTNVTIRQVRPWQGMVEVCYELTEDLSGDESPSTTIEFSDRQNNMSYAAKTFTRPFTYTKGVKRMIWHAAKDGVSFKSSNVVCTVTVAAGGLYKVVDLSAGVNAISYPVTTLSAMPNEGWTDEYKTTKLVLRRIESGKFTMGCPSGELGRQGSEKQHQVTLTKSFWIGVFEVTQRQWELVMGTRPSYFVNDSYYASRPVECVSYDMIRGNSAGAQWPASNAVDSDSFLGKLRAKTLVAFDLPTEAQWEYACRSGTTTALNNGKNVTSSVGSACDNMSEIGRYRFNGGSEAFNDDARYPSYRSTSGGTAKVGSYQSNCWGLYDMHGNVSEWCLDWCFPRPTDNAVDPLGPTTKSDSNADRVVRGGCWRNDAVDCRSASFAFSGLGSSYAPATYGFRLCCTSN